MAISVTLARTKMTDGSTKLQLKTPYSPDLPTRCRALGGKWNATNKAWYFDERDANRVRDLCVETFGIDPLAEPDEAPELVTVRLNLDAFNTSAAELWMFGREIVSRMGRDSAVRIGRDVVTISGGFAGSGGSRANPAISAKEGTILEVRDVPRALAEEQVSKWRPVAEQRAAMLAEKEIAAAGSTLGGLLPIYQREAEAAKTAVVIVENAPEPERVNPATAQIGALFEALQTADRRAVILSMIANMPSAERPALIKEIQMYLEQGAI